jgi:hypothetical protein
VKLADTQSKGILLIGHLQLSPKKEEVAMAKRIIIVALVTAVFSSAVMLFAQEQTPAPLFKEGDTWRFNISRKEQVATSTEQIDGLYELVFNQAAVKIYQIDGSQKTEIPIKPDGPTQLLLRLLGKSDQRPDLKFPLSKGQKWTYEFVTRNPGSKFDQRRSSEVNVTGTEQVTTPAGSFKAYKLIKTESWTVGSKRGSSNSSTSTYFYSPETRSIVKSSSELENSPGTTEVELINFTSGN